MGDMDDPAPFLLYLGVGQTLLMFGLFGNHQPGWGGIDLLVLFVWFLPWGIYRMRKENRANSLPSHAECLASISALEHWHKVYDVESVLKWPHDCLRDDRGTSKGSWKIAGQQLTMSAIPPTSADAQARW